jgi:hypothetical protein
MNLTDEKTSRGVSLSETAILRCGDGELLLLPIEVPSRLGLCFIGALLLGVVAEEADEEGEFFMFWVDRLDGELVIGPCSMEEVSSLGTMGLWPVVPGVSGLVILVLIGLATLAVLGLAVLGLLGLDLSSAIGGLDSEGVASGLATGGTLRGSSW